MVNFNIIRKIEFYLTLHITILMFTANVFFSLTQYIIAFEPKFSIGGEFSAKRSGAKVAPHGWGECYVPGVVRSSWRSFTGWAYRSSARRWGQNRIEWRSKGGREGGACSLRVGTIGWMRGTSHLDIMRLVSPTWSIVMCSKSTDGVHCWRHARAHDLLWWPTSSMSSSPLS